MRLFTGIALPAQVLDSLESLVRGLKPTARIKWSPVGNLHITTKFIGEWPAERLGELQAALREVPSPGQIPIGIRNLGWYPNERSPRVLWAGIEAPESLANLAQETDRRLATLGIRPEKRQYSPHLTLARIKGLSDLRELKDAMSHLPSMDFGEFQADRFSLYLSELKPSGSIYTSLAEYGGE